MAGQTLVHERPRHIVTGPAHPGFQPMMRSRAPREVLPPVGTLVFRWLILYSILLSAVWAFLGSSPE